MTECIIMSDYLKKADDELNKLVEIGDRNPNERENYIDYYYILQNMKKHQDNCCRCTHNAAVEVYKEVLRSSTFRILGGVSTY